MTRFRLMGLCLLAACALSALGAASASAQAPEFGRCIKKAKAEGTGFADSKCTKAGTGTKAKYEWLPGAVKRGQTSVGGVGILETVSKLAVKCATESSVGEYSGTKEVKNLIVKFKGCSSGPFECTSEGHENGELETKKLEGIVGIEKRAFVEAKEVPLKNKLAFDLFPAGKTGLFIEFTCGVTLTVAVRGSVLVPIKSNTMLTTGELKFKATIGKQKPERFEGEPKDILESSFTGKEFEQAGQTITSKVTNEEPLELNSVV
jgi:hypothetical protein